MSEGRIRDLTIIFPYYMNKGMLKEQFDVINHYPLEIRERLQLIVVDDCSPLGERAEEAIQQHNLVPNGFKFKLYRILTDLRWNWLQCRNLGAKEAETQWVLLTDIDHIIPSSVISWIFNEKLDGNNFYTFGRMRKVDGNDYHPHPNSYLMTKKLYWKVGGYDETFAGNYGTDGMYRRRCEEHGQHVQLLDQKLMLVGREVIPDASTRPEILNRKDCRDPSALKDIRDYKERHSVDIQTLRFPWKRVI